MVLTPESQTVVRRAREKLHEAADMIGDVINRQYLREERVTLGLEDCSLDMVAASLRRQIKTIDQALSKQ